MIKRSGRELLQLMNNISINRKLFIVTIVGAIFPMALLAGIFIQQSLHQYEARETIIIESIADSVASQLLGAMDSVQSTVYTYTTNMTTNRIITDPSSYDQEYMEIFLEDLKAQTNIDAMGNHMIRQIVIYTERPHLLALEDDSFQRQIMLSQYDWYKVYENNSRYLMIINAYTDGRPETALIKSFSTLDMDNRDFVYVKLDENELIEILGRDLLEGVEGSVYLVDSKGFIAASTENIYGKGESDLIPFDQVVLPYNGRVLSRTIGDEHYLQGWTVKFVLGNNSARASIQRQMFAIAIGVLVILAFMTMLNLRVTDSIVSRLRHINLSMERSEKKGLIQIEENMGSDEIGVTAGHFNKMVQRIRDLIYLDRLTGMKNRYAIIEIAEKAIRANTLDQRTAIVFIDVDNFKNINDTYGHDLGDKIIVQTAERLKHLLNDQVSIGRFGGDEFILVHRNIKGDQDINKLGKALKLFFSEPFVEDDKTFRLTLSAGASIYPDHGNDIYTLIKKADMSLYKAKESGRDQLVVFDQEMQEALKDKVSFEEAVKSAFANQEFYMNYQPYYYANKDEIAGFEGLIRWYSQEYGQVSPYKLIKTAESMGMIIELGYWIMDQCFTFAKKINDAAPHPIQVSVNISVIQMIHSEFKGKVMSLVTSSGVDPRVITLEMTETVLIQSYETSMEIINELIKVGFTISIDDFGTGYSSLGYLKSLPVDQVKIDRSFLKNIDDKQSFDRELVQSVTDLAHLREMKVVAEGVETQAQKDIAVSLGCDLLQGYHLGMPSSEEEAEKMIPKK